LIARIVILLLVTVLNAPLASGYSMLPEPERCELNDEFSVCTVQERKVIIAPVVQLRKPQRVIPAREIIHLNYSATSPVKRFLRFRRLLI